MRRYVLAGVVAVLAAASTAWAQGVAMEHFRIRVWGTKDYGIWLIIRDFGGQVVQRHLIRTPTDETEIPWRPEYCSGICRAEVERELSEAEYKEAERQAQLDRIENMLRGLQGR